MEKNSFFRHNFRGGDAKKGRRPKLAVRRRGEGEEAQKQFLADLDFVFGPSPKVGNVSAAASPKAPSAAARRSRTVTRPRTKGRARDAWQRAAVSFARRVARSAIELASLTRAHPRTAASLGVAAVLFAGAYYYPTIAAAYSPEARAVRQTILSGKQMVQGESLNIEHKDGYGCLGLDIVGNEQNSSKPKPDTQVSISCSVGVEGVYHPFLLARETVQHRVTVGPITIGGKQGEAHVDYEDQIAGLYAPGAGISKVRIHTVDSNLISAARFPQFIQ